MSIIIVIMEFADSLDIDVAKAVEEKINHNKKKYPAKLFKNKESSKESYFKIKKSYRAKSK